MDLPLDWENAFDTDDRTKDVHVDSASDALIMSLSTLGRVDIEYMASISGLEYKTVIGMLKGAIYQNPETWKECFYKGWETAEEYLSGNLIRKLTMARQANEAYNGYFSENIEAIKSVLPPSVATEDIYVTLGSPWLPADIVDEFIIHLLGDFWYYSDDYREACMTLHDPMTGTWDLPNKGRYSRNISATQTYGTERMSAMYILESTLNMRSIVVRDKVKCEDTKSGEKSVINESETIAALEKQRMIIAEFQKWIWKDKDREERLRKIFQDKYSCVRRRIFDGSFLTFPTMSKNISLYPYQKNAVARIIFSENTLLAHDVGAGKTYVMIAAGQELRRMGLSKKNMYVVPNNIVGQWESIFQTMYPGANVLVVDPKSFKPDNRKKILEKIAGEDYDGIIIAYSCFELIPISRQAVLDALEEEETLLQDAYSQKLHQTSGLSRKRRRIRDTIFKLLEELDAEDQICFDELGITRLFLDEAHNFKNVPIETKTTRILGINSTGSKKCKDMMDKVHLIQKQNDGKGVVFATGTPITNSITDAYIMQLYLQSGELSMLDMKSFDSWIGMFAEKKTEFEVDVDTSSFRLATRFSRFHNLPELTALLAQVADFHQVDVADGIPVHDGYVDTMVPRSDRFQDFLDEISERADAVRNGQVPRTKDNMLKITTDGRKAALDIRLVDDTCAYSLDSKVGRCAENVSRIYFDSIGNNGTQLIFCDTSTPKAGFNIYDDLRKRLETWGIPSEKIAYIHDATTEAKRKELFKKVRNGEIRVLIGSTFKLGIGVNVQDRLIAIHHIDVPWRPADMTQREGRILRQGNQNEEVFIHRYITEGSFDAYSWQLLETKQRFISDLLSGSVTERSNGDIEDTVLNYAEVKALAIGNPLVKQRVEAANELTRYLSLHKKLVDSRLKMEKELAQLPGKIEYEGELIEKCREDRDYYDGYLAEHPPIEDKKQKEEETARLKAIGEELMQGLMGHILEKHEKTLMNYKGFEVILPVNMDPIKPYVFLSRSGKYKVEMGPSARGNITRIDNALGDLGKRLDKLFENRDKMLKRKKDIRIELDKKEEYAEKIEEYKELVEHLDQKLGVNKDE